MDYFGTFGDTSDAALARVLPVVDSILEAHETGDYRNFATLVTEELRNKVTDEGFRKAHLEMQPTLGRLQSKRFLGALNRGGNPLFLWAAKYERCADDVLIRIGFKNGTEPPRVDWIWIE